METQLFAMGGVAHVAASLCENTEWSGNTQTHHQGHNQHFHLSICCCSAAPSPHICPPPRGRRANTFAAFSSKRRSVCFCLCLFVLPSLGSLHPNPADSFFLSLSQLAAALAFSSPLPASRFPPCVFPSLSLPSAGNLKLSSLFPAPTLYHPPTSLSS